MLIGIPNECFDLETRVALTPANAQALVKRGFDVVVAQDAGSRAGFYDEQYRAAGARLAVTNDSVLSEADVVAFVQADTVHGIGGGTVPGGAAKILLGSLDPLGSPQGVATLAASGATALAVELVPRITRAQSMDVLSSMAMIAGYKAVLMAAAASGRMFPMNMTAAGTLQAARVFVMGAGVAGLQAIATARRLGAVVEAYDVRPAAREQILSVGGKPVELDLATDSAEGQGGYAASQGEEFLRRQRELMGEILARQDVVITTAAVPGARSPILVTADHVGTMKPGAVIIDLAAERGGNCELTQAGETVVQGGVTILGPTNVPATVGHHASQAYGKNIENILVHALVPDSGAVNYDDEIVAAMLVAQGGQVCNPRVRSALGL